MGNMTDRTAPKGRNAQSEDLFECPKCRRWGPWTDGTAKELGDAHDEFWCQTCGAQSPVSECTAEVDGQRYPWHPDYPPAAFDVRLVDEHLRDEG